MKQKIVTRKRNVIKTNQYVFHYPIRRAVIQGRKMLKIH